MLIKKTNWLKILRPEAFVSIILIAGLLVSETGLALAQTNDKEFTVINAPLSTESEGFVHKIPEGSVIIHCENGVTEVRTPDNSLLLQAKDDV
ncbi:MAG: hypothetical protein Q7J73_02845 [Dehalococcoidales bacterium]|nr:hypothetical protein [Dehalococcoidales bacterium]